MFSFENSRGYDGPTSVIRQLVTISSAIDFVSLQLR
jgi:hypothetical protein